jgi:hypothetical protein
MNLQELAETLYSHPYFQSGEGQKYTIADCLSTLKALNKFASEAQIYRAIQNVTGDPEEYPEPFDGIAVEAWHKGGVYKKPNTGYVKRQESQKRNHFYGEQQKAITWLNQQSPEFQRKILDGIRSHWAKKGIQIENPLDHPFGLGTLETEYWFYTNKHPYIHDYQQVIIAHEKKEREQDQWWKNHKHLEREPCPKCHSKQRIISIFNDNNQEVFVLRCTRCRNKKEII